MFGFANQIVLSVEFWVLSWFKILRFGTWGLQAIWSLVFLAS